MKRETLYNIRDMLEKELEKHIAYSQNPSSLDKFDPEFVGDCLLAIDQAEERIIGNEAKFLVRTVEEKVYITLSDIEEEGELQGYSLIEALGLLEFSQNNKVKGVF